MLIDDLSLSEMRQIHNGIIDGSIHKPFCSSREAVKLTHISKCAPVLVQTVSLEDDIFPEDYR